MLDPRLDFYPPLSSESSSIWRIVSTRLHKALEHREEVVVAGEATTTTTATATTPTNSTTNEDTSMQQRVCEYLRLIRIIVV